MKNKLVLSIAMGSMIGMGFNTAQANTASDDAQISNAEVVVETPSTTDGGDGGNGGKCASGKCGTIEIYKDVKIDGNQQGKLIYARDGKCGIDGKGIGKTTTVDSDKQVNGLCGN